MKQGIILAFDAEGNSTPLCEPKTPLADQEKAFNTLKAGCPATPPPDWAVRIQHWVVDTVPTWIRPRQPDPAQTTTQDSKPRKEKKSK